MLDNNASITEEGGKKTVTRRAARKAGRKVKKGARKVAGKARKVGRKVKQGARKVARKTRRTARKGVAKKT